LHLVEILFPHINEDARSKPHQICETGISFHNTENLTKHK